MKEFIRKCCLVVAASVGALSVVAEQDPGLVIFPDPLGLKASDDYCVFADGNPVFCYPTWRFDRVHQTADVNGREVSPLSFATFDCSRAVVVRLELRPGLIQDPARVKILPSSLGIHPKVDGTRIEFVLDKPGQLTVDPNDDGLNALHLFTNLPETNIPNPSDPNVIYFGPGVHDIKSIVLKDNQTLYLAGGAVVRTSPEPTKKTGKSHGMMYTMAVPSVRINGAKNITICGRGILSGAPAFSDMKRFNSIFVDQSDGIEVRDIIVVDSSKWTVVFSNSRNIKVDNLKVLGYFENSDGICVSGSSNAVIKNSFVHNGDDGLEVKAWKPCDNILFENCQVWSDAGTPMGLTGEIFEPVCNAVWRGITVLNYTSVPEAFIEGRAAMLILALSGGSVDNITFEDITIESIHGTRPVARVTNEKLGWNGQPKTTDTPYSVISNVVFRNINAKNLSGPSAERLIFADGSGQKKVTGVTLQNIKLNGRAITGTQDQRVVNNGTELTVME